MTEAEADHWAAIMREVWIDQNAEMARLIAIGWWPARRREMDDRDEPMGGEA